MDFALLASRPGLSATGQVGSALASLPCHSGRELRLSRCDCPTNTEVTVRSMPQMKQHCTALHDIEKLSCKYRGYQLGHGME